MSGYAGRRPREATAANVQSNEEAPAPPLLKPPMVQQMAECALPSPCPFSGMCE